MLELTNDKLRGCKVLLNWVKAKPAYWDLVMIVSRTSPNHPGGIQKLSLTKEQVCYYLESIIRMKAYGEGDRVRLNRLRYLWEFDKKYELTENDIK